MVKWEFDVYDPSSEPICVGFYIGMQTEECEGCNDVHESFICIINLFFISFGFVYHFIDQEH